MKHPNPLFNEFKEPHVGNTKFNTLGLCAGVGMLDEGLAAGLRYMGFDSRCIGYAEREAYPVSVLEARMQEGSLDAAPIWFGDFTKFPARAFRGVVDCIVAGFPCQDISLAGRRSGLDGARSGLFFNILDIADDCAAQFLFLENVAAISSATASVVDEASTSEYVGNHHAKGFSQVGIEDGRLLERAAARVVGELADRGWDAEWLTLSASDVGAGHKRTRWFCWAWRRQLGHPPDQQRKRIQAGRRQAVAGDKHTGSHVVHAECAERRSAGIGGSGESQRHETRRHEDASRIGIPSSLLGGTGLQHQHVLQRDGGAEHSGAGQQVANTQYGAGCAEHGLKSWKGAAQSPKHGAEPGSNVQEFLAHPRCRNALRGEHISGSGELSTELHLICCGLANTGQPRSPQPESGVLRGTRGRIEGGAVEQLCPTPLFAPGPADSAWAKLLASHPELAPALEPSFRKLVNGLDFHMDDSRAARLKCVGNGVVPLQAAVASIVLAERAGLKRLQAHALETVDVMKIRASKSVAGIDA